MNRILLIFAGIIGLAGGAVSAQEAVTVEAVPYEWQNVPIVGGGFVDGIICHPTAKDVRYCRTDMGGAYKWDAAAARWVQLLDWLSLEDSNLQGVESIALDPQDPQSVYLACGTYTANRNCAILCSHDGCRTFSRVDVPFTTGGNENGRGNGERLMVDPLNGNIIYMGTRLHGLWRSTDKGSRWERVTSFPDVSETVTPDDRQAWWNRGSGIVSIAYDAQGNDPRGTRNIYVAASLKGRENLYVSHDYGESWQPVAGQPTQHRPTHIALTADRQLIVTYADTPGPSEMKDGAVWKYDLGKGKWTDVSPLKLKQGEPAGFGYAAVSVDVQNPKHWIVSTHCLGGKHGFESDELFRTTDGGKHWLPVFKTGYEYDYTKAPYTAVAPLHWMFDIEIDPCNPDHALFTTGFGGWETFNLSAVERGEKVKWSILAEGIEETVPLELYAPAVGARLVSGVGDYGGFTHFDLYHPNPEGNHANPHFANTNGVTGAWGRQELIVRVGALFGNQPGANPISYSEDGGRRWTMCKSVPLPEARNGHIAVSADGASWVWTPDRSHAYFTRDKGDSWQPCHGLPADMRVVADKVNPRRFYAVDAVKEIIYNSIDGGATFQADTLSLTVKQPRRGRAETAPQERGDNRGGQDRIYATPGREKDLWIAAYDGLYHSTATEDYDFRAMDKVSTIYAFGFGKAKAGNSYPALYLIGVVNGQYGFFRSDDAARSWVRINDDQHQYGLVLHICGDMQEYGRVYVGTHGRGIVMGAPKQRERQTVQNPYTEIPTVEIPAGTFLMGSNRGGEDADEAPLHRVTLTHGFRMGTTEVTNAQYEQFCPEHRALRGRDNVSTADDDAVVNVSWADATAFCRWLSERSGKTWRLPTEAEWEYACRATTTTDFYTGDTLPASMCRNQVIARDYKAVSLRVGQTVPNAFGLYDMHGNVEEWCTDWYAPYTAEAQTDPAGPPTGLYRVTRGGSHHTPVRYLRSANRMAMLPDDSHSLTGFRVVQEPTNYSATDLPFFAEPIPYVIPPTDTLGVPFYSHNHQPSIAWCDNGDLLADWFSANAENGREMVVLCSRLRAGAETWEPAKLFFKVPDRNMTGTSLFNDGRGKLFHMNGVEAAGDWQNLAMTLRESTDNGLTWSRPRIVAPAHTKRHQVISGMSQTPEGWLIQPCDAGPGGNDGAAIHVSRDGGLTWEDPWDGNPNPDFKPGGTGTTIAGIHAGVVTLQDGSLLALGRGNSLPDAEGRRRMPMSRSADMGRTWHYEASPFPPIDGGQRLVLMRLREGPLLLVSFTDHPQRTPEAERGMTFPSAGGQKGYGMYAALSYDEGQTWPVRRLLTDGQRRHLDGGAWTGDFLMDETHAETKGYLAGTQSPDGVIHILSSRLHYRFNLKWIEASR